MLKVILRIHTIGNFEALDFNATLLVSSYDLLPQAYGVKFWHEGKEKIARTHGEVILSAGAIASPQLLMLSGIGPAKHLAEHHIPVLVDLPVGYNMQSHVGVGELIFTLNEPVIVNCKFSNECDQ